MTQKPTLSTYDSTEDETEAPVETEGAEQTTEHRQDALTCPESDILPRLKPWGSPTGG